MKKTFIVMTLACFMAAFLNEAVQISDVVIAAFPTKITQGDQAQLVLAFTAPGPATVVWSDNFVQDNVVIGTDHLVSPKITTTYTATISQGGFQVSSDPVTITVEPLPKLDVTLFAKPNCFCNEGSSSRSFSFCGAGMKKRRIELEVKILGGKPPFKLKWSDGFKQTSNKRDVKREVSIKKTTDFRVSVESSNHQTGKSNRVTATICKRQSSK